MRSRGAIATALVLIGIGAWFLAVELFPAVKAFAYGPSTWPLQIIGIGVWMAVVAVVTWTPGWLIPASLVAGIGALLYWQNATGNWASWVYTWTLIPGFVGIGLLLAGLLRGQRGMVIGGFWTIFGSMVLFAIFGSFLGGFELISRYWPVMLIIVGVAFLFQGIFGRR